MDKEDLEIIMTKVRDNLLDYAEVDEEVLNRFIDDVLEQIEE